MSGIFFFLPTNRSHFILRTWPQCQKTVSVFCFFVLLLHLLSLPCSFVVFLTPHKKYYSRENRLFHSEFVRFKFYILLYFHLRYTL